MIRARLGTGSGLATAAIIAAVAALPAPALGASGTTTLTLDGPAAKGLREAGIQLAPLRPAKGGKAKLVLPVAAGLAGAETTLLRYRGGLALRATGGEQLSMTKLRLMLGKRSRLSAKLGGGEVDVFAVSGKGRRTIDTKAGTVELEGLRLKLTRAGAKAIAAQLAPAVAQKSGKGRLKQPALEVRPGRFGTLSARVSGLVASGDQKPGPDSQKAKASAGCPLPSTAGPTPQDPLPVATRPPGAADIVSAAIDWHVRESFIRYIATGEGTSVSGGASAEPPVLLPGASVPLSYDFHFPFAGGWHDSGANPADPADDTATIDFGGALRFLYSGHEIDLSTSVPEIEIAGAASRAIFAVSENGGAPTRQVLVNLDLSRAAAITANGNTYTYQQVPGAVPSGTATSVFAGFYAPGTDFGCFTVTYTTS